MTTRKLVVPDELDATKLLKAIEHDPPPRDWPEGEKYIDAPQCSAIAAQMIGRLHTHLATARIGFVFKEHMAGRGRLILAKASKAGGALAFLSSFDFVIVFNWTHWKDMDVRMRCALVDHELMHCQRDLDTGAFLLLGHDVEEFGAIVRRWGFWKPDLLSFAEIVKVQLELFTSARSAKRKKS